MGTDDFHHKRKAKRIEDVSRRKASRAPYDKVLIVCEGEKTEPLYFSEIKDYYEINSANISITGECGSDPVSVVTHALRLYHDDKKKDEAFDRVYCVFDQDSYNLPPNKYQQALDKLAGAKPKGTFFAITSVPCFEYWLLLHFVYTTAQFSSVGGVSVGAAVLQELNKVWPEYTKAQEGTFVSRLQELEFAKANASRSLEDAKENHTDHPSTCVHELVEYLQRIKSPKKYITTT